MPVLVEALNGFSKSGTGVVGGGVVGASEGAVEAAEGDVGGVGDQQGGRLVLAVGKGVWHVVFEVPYKQG